VVVAPGRVACERDSAAVVRGLVEPVGGLGVLTSVRAERRAPGTASLAGEVSAGFEEFYRMEYPRTVRLAWLLTHSSGASEDLTQDAFAAVYRRFDDLDHPVRYLRAALVYRCKSWHRDELFRRRRLARLQEEQCEMSLPDPQLMRAVKKLPYRQQVVIFARYWADWPEAEIAEVLGCRPGTVKSLASRALARLREEVRTNDQHG
jgi:RNA polymerase sigma factor (sigma-70 family)